MRRFIPVLLTLCACGADLEAQVTYSKEISRIFQARCQQCHRQGDITPFALDSYDAAVAWARDVQNSLEAGTMPPWKPVPGYGDFRDARTMPDDEKQMVLDWIGNGMPEGDPADLPAPLPDAGPWPLGQPDMALAMTQSYTPPIGADVYRCFVVPMALDANTDMSAVDFLPGDRQIVHHIILFQDTTGQAQMLDGADGQPGYTCFGGPGIDLSLQTSVLAGWAPGQRSAFLPDGIGIQVRQGATLIMQVHYSPLQVTGPDLTQIGLYFARTPVQQHLFQVPVLNDTFTIPAGASNYVVTDGLTVPPLFDAKAIEIYPHMHLLGQTIRVDLVGADQSVTPMVYEDAWDFRWQGYYTYTSPVALQAGSTVRITCSYDNSEDNPNNPNNPLVPVSWGERTADEMCIALVGVTFDNEKYLPVNFLEKMVQRK
jgi:hypothetical protein